MKHDFKKSIMDMKDDKKLWETIVYDKLWYLFKPFFFIIDEYHKYSERIKRSWAYAKFGWKNYDFDSAYAFDLLLFKLKRIRKACIDEGIHVVEKKERQSLDLCIKLLERILNRDYGETFRKAHDEKWGEIQMRFEPCTIGNKHAGSRIITNRPNVVTEADEKQELKEHKFVWEMEEKLEQQDVRKFFAIYEKYYKLWWD